MDTSIHIFLEGTKAQMNEAIDTVANTNSEDREYYTIINQDGTFLTECPDGAMPVFNIGDDPAWLSRTEAEKILEIGKEIGEVWSITH